LTQFRVIVTYIRLLFIPINQNMDYDYPLYNTFFEPWVFFSFIFLLSIFAFAVYLFIRSRKTDNVYGLLASFGILWFFITLSVESSIIPIRDVIFEHRLYLPGVGAAVAFSSAAFYVFGLLEAKLSPLVAACVLIVVISLPLGVAANQRNYVWGDAVTFWQDIVKKSPLKARGHNNLGEAYNERGQMDNGIEELEIALRLKPGYADAHTNLGIAYGKKGLLDKAEAELLEALKLLPNLAVARNNLGIVYARKGRLNRAIEEYKTALGLKPDFAEAHNNLGNVYYKEGRMDEAIEEYNEALRLTPSYAEAHNNLGNVYYKQGRMDEAIEEYNEALRLESDLIETHFNLGLAYKRKGLNKEALKEFEKVLEISPDNEKARKMLQSISR
jgi:Tfp pilus assembly protein PilF